MTATRHTISATRSVYWNGMDVDNDYTITFTLEPGAEPVFVAVEPLSDYGPAAADEKDWAANWLDENADKAIEKAAAEVYSGTVGDVDLATASGLPLPDSTDHRDWDRLRSAAEANGFQPVQGSTFRCSAALVWRKG